MPITMMFASDFEGAPHLEYATDHRVQSAAQLKLAERFDLDDVSAISDSCIEAAGCGADIAFVEMPRLLSKRTYRCFAIRRCCVRSACLSLVKALG